MITMMTHGLSMDQLHVKDPAVPAAHSVSRAMRRELLEVPKGGRRKIEGARFSRFFFEFVSGFGPVGTESVAFFLVLFGGGMAKVTRMDVGGPHRIISLGVENVELVTSIGEKDCSKIDVLGRFFLPYSPESCFHGSIAPQT